jgi:hypothetical protein
MPDLRRPITKPGFEPRLRNMPIQRPAQAWPNLPLLERQTHPSQDEHRLWRPGRSAPFAGCAVDAFHQPGASRRIVSLGAGECEHEIALIKKLLEMGETDFVLEALELSPVRSERARERARNEGVGRYLTISEADLNSWVPEQKYSIVIAKDTLHHVLELEHLFDSVHEGLDDEGTFLTSDMIGRNGHMRWPEALEIIQGIWKFIPDHYKTNHQLKRVEQE